MEWRKLHNEELNDLYSLSNIIRVIKSRIMRWTWHVACMGKGEVNEMCWWGKRPLGRPRHRGDNIKMDLQEVGWRGTDWIDLFQDRGTWRTLVNAVMNLWFP